MALREIGFKDHRRRRGNGHDGFGTLIEFDGVVFSNSLTVEKSVFSGGAIGHVLRTRSTNPSTYAQTDAYFHFDQVGSVMAETNAAGALSQTHHQEAFGQTLASWSTGLVGGDRSGLHHNTKEFDGEVGLVYMYQRWHLPEMGAFISQASMPVFVEPSYTFGFQDPTGIVDPEGRMGARERKIVDECMSKAAEEAPPGACRSGAEAGCELATKYLREAGIQVIPYVHRSVTHDVCYIYTPNCTCTLDRLCLWDWPLCVTKYKCQCSPSENAGMF